MVQCANLNQELVVVSETQAFTKLNWAHIITSISSSSDRTWIVLGCLTSDDFYIKLSDSSDDGSEKSVASDFVIKNF